MPALPTTDYFRAIVLPKRAYLTLVMVEQVARSPEHTRVQPDGRTRLWARVPELEGRWLRVVRLEDGHTIHNAFLDRDGPPQPRTP